MRHAQRTAVLAVLAGALAMVALGNCVFTIAPLAETTADAGPHADAEARSVDAEPDARDATLHDARDAGLYDASEGGCDDAALTTDPSNCGACNHSCLEGGCLGGQCLPVSLFSKLGSSPSGIYVADDTVFVTLYLPSPSGEVLEVQPANDVLQAGLAQATLITGTGTTTLYWTVRGNDSPGSNEAGIGSLGNGVAHFLSLDLPHAHPRPIVVMDGGDIAFGIAVDDGGGGSVMRAAGSLASPPKVVSTVAGAYLGLATDGTRLWATCTSDKTLYRLDPGDGGAPTTQHVVYVNADAGPDYVAYRDGRVFLSNYAGSYVGVIDHPTLDGQPMRLLVTPKTAYASSPLDPDAGQAIAAVFGIAADDRYVYWTDKNSGSVGRVSYADGGPAQVFAFLPGTGPNQLYVTDAAVYFTALINGSVYRVAK